MKINSINNTYNYKNNVQSFKGGAVPYPEYASAYIDTMEVKKELGRKRRLS